MNCVHRGIHLLHPGSTKRTADKPADVGKEDDVTSGHKHVACEVSADGGVYVGHDDVIGTHSNTADPRV